MRKFCASLVLCLLWLTPIPSQVKTDKDRDGLVGPVKCVEAYLIDFVSRDNRIVEGERRPWYTTNYNTEGNISETQLINIEYDSHGNWTRKTRLKQSEKGSQPQAYHAELRVITYY